ncbi:fungal cellulose binding domain-containing protein [Plectosphaerella plurivora]|uniref:Fungal cellulose binding domain-containing protein n=1 Tax=Plectosphaerella plurivora TaxID=936078 RepID=A0A9P8UZT7_9PEZI|nr:fungal cellulose binding domain-containing protein [Plectosphaerella plurivora]
MRFFTPLAINLLAATAASAAVVHRQADCSKAVPAPAPAPVKNDVKEVVAAAGPNYLISFGDSYSQTGFNVNGAKANADNPIGNPSLPGFTASGGSNWVGFAVTEVNAGELFSYNLAYGGATTAADIVKPFAADVQSFQDQVNTFKSKLAGSAPWKADNALVAVWIGVNDVGNTFYGSTTPLYEQIITRYFAQLQTLYDMGLRNFALLSTPPIDKTPSVIRGGPNATGKAAPAIARYNQLLAKHLAEFKSSHADVKTWLIDTATAFNKALSNPKQYGAPDGTCYNSDGKSCLWWNDYHPGIAIQKLVAEELAATVGAPFFKA